MSPVWICADPQAVKKSRTYGRGHVLHLSLPLREAKIGEADFGRR
jgi:hypothetical protein